MEGALGTRLRAEFGLRPDPAVALATHVCQPAGRKALEAIYAGYLTVASAFHLPFLANTATRRVNRERLARSGHGPEVIAAGVAFLRSLPTDATVFVGGTVGCRGDAYTGEGALDRRAAAAFHAWTVEHLAAAGVDYIFAPLQPTLPEALGLVDACGYLDIACIVSFTLDASGCLPDGTSLAAAISTIDGAVTRPPLEYMANCLHPEALIRALTHPCNRTDTVRRRFRGLQANASRLPRAVLDGAATVWAEDPEALADAVLALDRSLPLHIVGGCCGTDQRFLQAVAHRLCRRSPPEPANPRSGHDVF